MNEFDFNFNDYKYGALAIARKYNKQMNKNEKIEIRALQNGYLVERSWRERRANAEDSFDYNYVDEQSMFKTWDEVVEFITSNKLEVPPQKI